MAEEKKVGVELCREMYDLMNLKVSTDQMSSWADISVWAERDRKWVYDKYLPWLEKEHPGKKESIELIMAHGKELGVITRNKITMESILSKEKLDSEDILRVYKQEVVDQIKGSSGERIKAMLDAMEQDIMTTRTITMQACMLAITGYLLSLKKRIDAGEQVSEKEFKTAYEIFKTEIGEPTKIKEMRSKNMQVTLNVPLSKEDVSKVFSENRQQDLSIEVADIFKNKLEDKFSIINAVNDQHRRDNSQTGDN